MSDIIEKPRPDTPTDLVILLMAANEGDAVDGIVRLDKMLVMLMSMNVFPPECFKTVTKPYKYGPFAETLLDDLQALEEIGFLQIHDTAITCSHFGKAAQAIYDLSPNQTRALTIVKGLMGHMDLLSVLNMAYWGNLEGRTGRNLPL